MFRNPSAIAFAPEYSPQTSTSFVGLNAVIVDKGNNLIRKLYATGSGDLQVSTLAGTLPVSSVPVAGNVDGESTAARFSGPSDAVFVSGASYIVVADSGNHRLRAVNKVTGSVTTLAGSGLVPGHRDGAATQARFSSPQGVAVTGQGLLLVADSGNHAIRVIDLGTSTVSTLAGSIYGFAGFVNGVGLDAAFNTPLRIAVLPGDTAVVTDSVNSAVRLVDVNTRAVTTLAGTGVAGFLDGDVFTATLSTPVGVARLGDGELLIAD
ncbi:hypothetical protein T484DRAFT_1673967, partial [Baffinella frigidus]